MGSERLFITLVLGYEKLSYSLVRAEVDGEPNCYLSLTIQGKNKLCRGAMIVKD